MYLQYIKKSPLEYGGKKKSKHCQEADDDQWLRQTPV